MSPSLKPKAKTKPCNKPKALFTKSNKVEVMSDEEGFRGVWYESTVLKPPPMSKKSKKKSLVLVKYDTLLAADGVSPLVEYVCPKFVRPLPPKHDGNVSDCFQVCDVVDAYHLDGWWRGVVSSVREVDGVSKYMVVFELPPPHQVEFCGEDLRVHFDWISDEWVKATKENRMKGIEYSKGMMVEVNLCRGRPKYVWVQALILEEHGYNSFLVECAGQGNNEGRKRIVDSFHIRPPHPIFKTKEFELMDKVCVFHGWTTKEGFITYILPGESYVVYLKGEKVTKKFTKSKLMPCLEYVDGKWMGLRCKDRSLNSYCQGQNDILVDSKERSPDVTIQLDCASSENTQVVEQNPFRNSCMNQLNYLTTCSSIFKKARSRASRRKITKSAKLSSGESHQKSKLGTPLEKSNRENSTSCMLADFSSNPVAEKNPSVESTIPDSTKEIHEEEAVMEDNMPQNLELQVQQVSASGEDDNGKGVLEETSASHSSTDCMTEKVIMDASPVTSCQGTSDDLESASDLNNQVQEKSPCNSAALNSEFMSTKRRSCDSKAESPSPCKKFRGENYVTCLSSVECHEMSPPIEQLNVEKITCCMLPQYSSNPVVGEFPSVESTSPIICATNEEATLEADMITSVDKIGVPENSERKCQQISASGEDQITEEYMATSSLLNSCDNLILDQPQELCSKGEKDNRKSVSVEMLTPQFSADFIAGVDVIHLGPNHLVKSDGMLMDDQCQFLCSEETLTPLVTTHCMETIATDNVVAECILESCGISNVDQQFQLCLEGGKSNRKIMSAETSTRFSAIDCMTEEADIVDIVADCRENCNGTPSVQQPPFLLLEGHCHSNIQNQCNGAVDGPSVSGIESSVEVNNGPVENVEMPFIKNPRLWRFVDSLEIFKVMPQNPHFHPLMKVGEAFREGFALGHMITFSTVAEKISELQVTDSQNKFDNFLETLSELEMHGFQVKPLLGRVNMLSSMKDEHRQLEDQSKEVNARLVDHVSEQLRLNRCVLAINKVLSELEKDRQMYVLLEKNHSRDITKLQRDGSSIRDSISATMDEFKSVVTAPW